MIRYILKTTRREQNNRRDRCFGRKSEGCIAVEMEVAGVQAVCDFFGLELYDFLAAGDVLAEGNYITDGLSDANHNLDKLAIALRIIERI